MRRLILGTAGHIDHGKTELVRALTGVDTDRLKEEKERGITIDLGFAELSIGDLQLGVIDVPGHEGFIRNMLAGATGMDVVVLVIAADEGVMPQTREHLSILSLLGVQRLIVALTKADLVEEEWLGLVGEEVRELLADTLYRDALLLPTSARTGRGLQALVESLRLVAEAVQEEDPQDLARLPIDRVFSVRGTGTVVTGTLWSGSLRTGEKVRILPGEIPARVRGLQVHGREVDEAWGGQRTAVALVGTGVERAALARGQVLVCDAGWGASGVMTIRASVIGDSTWMLESGQRVRVHLGTAERLARVVLLGPEALGPGEEGWAQLRLEAPAVARARERVVLRSYSPVTTLGGGVVAEPLAPKRARLSAAEERWLADVLAGDDGAAVAARAEVAGWKGESTLRLPVTTGLPSWRIQAILSSLPPLGAPESGAAAIPRRLPDGVISGAKVTEGLLRLEQAVDAFHAAEPLRPGLDVETLRQALPRGAHPELPDALLDALVSAGRLVLRGGLVSRPGFSATLGPVQERLLERLAELYRTAALTPPMVEELPEEVRGSPDFWPILRLLEGDGRVTRVDGDLFMWSDALRQAAAKVRQALAGREGLGPADFREALPLTRKHLLPILAYLDQLGVTRRRGNVRDVPEF